MAPDDLTRGKDLSVGTSKPLHLRHVLFADVDGTLLTRQHRIHADVVSAAQRLSVAGIPIVLATARSPHAVLPYARQLGVAQLCICFNGAWVGNVATIEPIHELTLSRANSLAIAETARSRGYDVLWYQGGCVYSTCATPAVEREIANTKELLKIVSDVNFLPGRPNKLLCIAASDDGFSAIAPLKNNPPAGAVLMQSGARLMEVVPSEAGKGNAVRIVAGAYELELQQCAGAGDSENDLSLLSAVGHRISLQNGVDSVRAIADFVGPDCDEGGLAKGMDWFASEVVRHG